MPYSDEYNTYQLLRAFATLPAAGAYDTPVEVFVNDFEQINLFLSYIDGGGTGGSVKFLIEFSPHANDVDAPANTAVWYKTTAVETAAITPGTAVASTIQDKETEFTPVGLTTEGIVINVTNEGLAAQRMRVSVAETGDIANPGDCSLIMLAVK